MNNTNVDSYLRDGCGRCDRYQTPECKVHRWTDVLVALREIVLETELVEEMKWGQPCYTLDGQNVLMVTAFKNYCVLSFFKGVALTDDAGLLAAPGPNSRYVRRLEFTSLEEVMELRQDALRLINEAIELEREGIEVEPSGGPEPMPIELQQRLAGDPDLERAFDELTPGRQRSHILYVSGAKKADTRERRVERCVPKIVAGKGFHER